MYHDELVGVTAQDVRIAAVLAAKPNANFPIDQDLIVAVHATCIPEIVHDGVNGILAAPGDVDGLAKAMSRLLQDMPEAVCMGQASRVIGAQHETCLTVDAHENLYRKMLQLEFTASPAPVGEPICSR